MLALHGAGRRARRAAAGILATLPILLCLLAVSCDDAVGPVDAGAGPDFSGQYNPLRGTLVFRLPAASGAST